MRHRSRATRPKKRPPIRFTLGLTEHGTGIGDQVYQTQLLYNIGRSCGWTYVHNDLTRPWANRDRTKGARSRFDYHSFLGIGDGEEQLSDYRQPKFLDVDSKDVLEALIDSEGTPPDTSHLDDEDFDLVRLQMNGWFYRDYQQASASQAIPLRHVLDLSARYARARRNDPVMLPFTRGKIPIVIHVRLMDVCWYEDDGKIVIPAYPHAAGQLDAFVAPHTRYRALIEPLLHHLGPDRCELWIYSDGIPPQAWLARYLMPVCGDARTAERLAARAIAYQREELARFKTYDVPARFRIGSTTARLKEVVHAFATAPYALSCRVPRLVAGRCWQTPFPNLGQRAPGLPPVIGLHAHTAASMRALVDAHPLSR
jgi:hypothetical protein